MQSTTPLTSHAYQAGSYTDFTDLARLRREANHAPDAAMQKVAKQFESLFINMMLKSMRQASFGDPIFDSHQSELYRDMFDNQIALNMSEGRGIGLAQALMVQLGRYVPQSTSAQQTNQIKPVQIPNAIESQDNVEVPATAKPEQSEALIDPAPLRNKVTLTPGRENPFTGPESFVQELWPHAKRAARELGVQAEVLIAQAALETGWGKAVNRHQDGTSSYNLFNIKADSRWKGDSVNKITLEYRDGIAQKESARFRAYNSFAESFDDYVRFIKGNPRYQPALEVANDAAHYIEKLQDAGYATDPAYANKVKDIMRRDYFDTASMHATAVTEG